MSETFGDDVQADELIGRLVPDPENPDVRRMVGFRLGESDRPAFWRLYLTPDLFEYVEFRKEDCLHAKELRSGNTMVWLKPSAKLAYTLAEEAALRFLRGDIRRRFLRTTSFSAIARAANEATGTGALLTRQNCCCFTIGRNVETADFCGPV